MELLRKRVVRYIMEHALCLPGDTLVVAFSGGADSAALLDIMAHLPGFHVRIVVAHLNHLLRGVESAADEQFARDAAARYSVPFVHSRVDVAALAAQSRHSLEEAGREARYAFFRGVAAQYAAAAVAVGHHQGDQAETVMMRLLRGAGGSGLSGMRPKSSAGMIVRPLLSINRAEIEAYLRQGGLEWREDSSNADPVFLRNRIRHELLPYLETFTPDLEERLCQTAAALAADEDVLAAAAAGVFARSVTVSVSGAEAAIDVFCMEPIALRKRLYRQAIRSVKGDLRRIAYTHLAAIDRLVFADRPNSELALPGGIRAVRTYRVLRFTTEQEDPPLAGSELIIGAPGLYSLPCGGSMLIEMLAGSATAEPAVGSATVTALIAQLPLPLTVRYYRNADRFIPLGMSSHKKLKDLFIDRKIPLKDRRRIPLLVVGDEIVWICGVQLSAAIKVTAAVNGLPWLRITYTAAVERY